MKILSSQQIREADQYTIANEPIASIDLMERASRVFVDWFKIHYSPRNPVSIYCGPGNNGGDGLAVARLLHQEEYQVKVILVKFGKGTSEDFQMNLDRLRQRTSVSIHSAGDINGLPELSENDIVIDAILGSGLSRPATGFVESAILHLNENAKEIVSIDIPSGLFSDSPTSTTAVNAKRTLSFERPKLAFFLPSNGKFVGGWAYRSIGLDQVFLSNQETRYHLITPEIISSIYRPRKKFDHKGTYGHSLLIAGSKGKIGAAILAAKAALRSGTGLLSIYAPSCGYEILQSTVPEAMVQVDTKKNLLSSCPSLEGFRAIGVGPGIGTDKKTEQMLGTLIKRSAIPLIVDADGLNILSKKQKWLKKLPKNSILTPHPKEFERLFGKTKNDFKRLLLLKKKAEELNIFIILKGAHTAVACPSGDIWFNDTGNPGLGTGGSGDVLTGMLTGLMAQSYSSYETAVVGVYLHGLAGDLAAKATSEEAMIAGDITRNLGKAFLTIKPGQK